MKVTRWVLAGVAVAAVLTGGCSSNSKSPTTPSASSTSTTTSAASSSAQPQPADYAKLLLDAKDINAPEIFTASAPIKDPNGQPGVATTFSNPDGTHIVRDTILILPDAGAASAALDSAKTAQTSSLKGNPVAIDIGTGGTTVSGSSPDGSKGLTVLLFTVDKAFATLEFDGPPDALAPPDFVTDVGQKQATAIKNGLGG